MAQSWLFGIVVLHFLLMTKCSRINPSDLAALRQIKNSLTDIPSSSSSNSRFFSTWDFSAATDPCSSFAGVTCSATRVTILTLGTGLSNSPGLAGTLSPAISQLQDLTQLILFAGIVTGPIPPQIAALRNLKVLSLTNNRLTGAIPPEILRLSSLHTLDLSRNQLSGTIPPPLAPVLKILVLANNRLSGQIPRTLPPQLLHLDLSNNLLSGTLPATMPAALRYVSAANNRLWGTLKGLEALSEVAYLDLSMNQLSGPIPTSLFSPTVTSLLLQRNNLSGGVPPSPPSIGGLTMGSTVDLSHNFLTGELTTALTGADTLFLNNNRLSGAVPAEYVESVAAGSMKTLYLQHNYLTGFPLHAGSTLPDAAAVCVSYNCMTAPPVGMEACPDSAGDQISRPAYQCSAFHNSLN